jgi:hypothetical protein
MTRRTRGRATLAPTGDWRIGRCKRYPRELFVPCLTPRPSGTVAALAHYGVPVEVLDARTVKSALAAVAARAA